MRNGDATTGRGSQFLSRIYTGDSGWVVCPMASLATFKWFMVWDFLSLTFHFDPVFVRGTCVACFDGTRAMGHGSPDVCSMTIPKCVVVIVICSVLTHSWNKCQGTVNVQSCLLHAV